MHGWHSGRVTSTPLWTEIFGIWERRRCGCVQSSLTFGLPLAFFNGSLRSTHPVYESPQITLLVGVHLFVSFSRKPTLLRLVEKRPNPRLIFPCWGWYIFERLFVLLALRQVVVLLTWLSLNSSQQSVFSYRVCYSTESPAPAPFLRAPSPSNCSVSSTHIPLFRLPRTRPGVSAPRPSFGPWLRGLSGELCVGHHFTNLPEMETPALRYSSSHRLAIAPTSGIAHRATPNPKRRHRQRLALYKAKVSGDIDRGFSAAFDGWV